MANDAIAALQTDVAEIRADIQTLKKALLGDPEYKTEGYIQRVKSLEERLTRVENVLKGGRWFITGLAAAAGYGAIELFQAIANLFKK